jgi:hypothetical protein
MNRPLRIEKMKYSRLKGQVLRPERKKNRTFSITGSRFKADTGTSIITRSSYQTRKPTKAESLSNLKEVTTKMPPQTYQAYRNQQF